MYSRYGDSGKRSIRLPEHYGGSVFQQLPTEPIPVPKREVPRSYTKEGIGEKASPVAERLLRAEATEEKRVEDFFESSPSDESLNLEESRAQQEEQTQSIPTEKKATPPSINFDGFRRLLGGDGEGDKDRLLLLGLILLLSRTEGDSDVLLWLSLLLLCG